MNPNNPLTEPVDDTTGPAPAGQVDAVRQPRGVEQHGVEPVPLEQRTVGWWDLFQILINVLLNPGLILIGGLSVVAGLSFWAAVFAQVLAIVITFVAYTIMGTVGVDYGLPGIVSTRAFLGIHLSRWILSALRAVSSAFFFAFQTLAGALGIKAVLAQLFSVDLSLILVSVVFAVFQAIVALFGYNSLKWLSKIAFPLKVVILGYLLVVMARHDAPGFSPGEVFSYQGRVGWEWTAVAVWVNTIAAGWFSQVTDAADYCRYSRSRRHMWIGTMAAAVIGTAGAGFFGAYAAAATLGKESNPFEIIPELGAGTWTLVMVLIVLILDNWTINVLNLYTGGLSLANLATRLGRFWSTVAIALLGTFLAAMPAVVNDVNEAYGAIGSVFGPIAGVIVADYLILKRGRINVSALFDPQGPYRYVGGVNLLALAWIVIGLGIYLVLPDWTIPVAAAALLTAVGYAVTARLTPVQGIQGTKEGI